MQKYRVAVVGCGRMAGTIDDEVVDYPALTLPYSHCAAYAVIDRTEIVAAADIDRAKGESLCQRYGISSFYTDYRQMIEREKPDIVSVCTHSTAHAEITIFAAEHGAKGIYSEKAMACSAAEADAMVAALESHNVKFNMGTLRRWHPGHEAMRKLITDGVLGNISTIVSYTTGSLLHSGSHYFDSILYFGLDRDVEWVQGNVFNNDWDPAANAVDHDLSGTAVIKFKDGPMAFALCSPLVAEFEVIGSEGAARCLNNSIDWQLRLRNQRYGERYTGYGEVPFPAFPAKSATVNLIEDILQAIETDGPTRQGPHIARLGTEIALAVVESHRQRGAKITLPLQNRTLYMASR